MLAYYMHDLSPFLIKFGHTAEGNPFGIRWYGVSYLMGFVAAYMLLMWMAKKQILKVPVARVPDLVLNACIWGVLVGGRLGFVLFYDTKTLWDFSESFPFWGLLKVWQGGMSAHGGVVGVIVTLIIWCRKNKYSFVNVGDCSCMVVPLGLLFGRLANFINGELYGAITNVSWGVKFPSELPMPTNGKIDPTLVKKVPELLNSVGQQVNGILRQVRPDMQAPIYDVSDLFHLYAHTERALPKDTPPGVVEQVHQVVATQLYNFLPARHPSQLYEAATEGLLLFIICFVIGMKFRKAGMVSGAFLTLYPVMRISCEYFRIGSDPPDWLKWTHVTHQGIFLSVIMFVPGVIYWGYWACKKPELATPVDVKSDQPSAGC